MITPEMAEIASRFESILDQRSSRDTRQSSGAITAVVSEVDSDGVTWVNPPGASEAIPIEQMTSSAKPGDMVLISISDGVGSELGNMSCPATDDTVAKQALVDAAIAQEAASKATRSAEQAESAAESAQASADSASENARKSLSYLLETEDSWTAINNYRTQAQRTMVDIGAAADSAQTDAGIAHTAASQATFGLSEVEKVVGTLNWISEHATYSLTQDQAVVDGKLYYTRSGSGTTQDPYVYTPVIDPQSSGLSSYYEMVLDKSVQNYIASHLAQTNYGLDIMVDGSLFKIHLGTVDGTHTMATYIIDAGGDIVASFGADGFQIGKDNESHMVGDYHSLQLVSKGGDTYFHVSDLADRQGIATIVEKFEESTTGTSISVNTMFWIYDVTSIEVDGVEIPSTDWSIDLGTNYEIDIYNVTTGDHNVVVTYTTNEGYVNAYTFGHRLEDEVIGPCSVAEGWQTIASGVFSHAEGEATEATDWCAHVEGNGSIADGIASHAEGSSSRASGSAAHAEGSGKAIASYTHAEGYESKAQGYVAHAEGYITTASGRYAHAEGKSTTASGESSHAEGEGCTATGFRDHAEGYNATASGGASHAEGYNTVASGSHSHAQNYGTIADGWNQTALGKYNIKDIADKYAVIVGNGLDNSNRSDALRLGWSGDVYLALETNVSSGIDHDIYSALTTLGWASDIIV